MTSASEIELLRDEVQDGLGRVFDYFVTDWCSYQVSHTGFDHYKVRMRVSGDRSEFVHLYMTKTDEDNYMNFTIHCMKGYYPDNQPFLC